MDFAPSERTARLQAELQDFMDGTVLPAEPVFAEQAAALVAAGRPWDTPAVLAELKAAARARGLWNLFLPDPHDGAGLSVLEYAPLAEQSGWSPHLAPEAMNCSAPDTGNMEILHMFGTPGQRERWLRPLLDGEIRSCFSMTEPAVASSDATNIATRIERDGDDYVVTGRKWWSTGAMSPHCRVAIVMGVTDPDADTHSRQSMVLVPLDAPGVTVVRSTQVFGYTDGTHGGHAEIDYDHVRVPATNLLGAEGGGFAIAQARLGPGRIHHCMRALGMAERALDLTSRRAVAREAFGRPLARHGVVYDGIAQARIDLEQARLLVLKTAWLVDTAGVRGARVEISAIKAVVPRLACDVVDMAIQVHGGAGVCEDTVLAEMYAGLRTLRIADGPDEVHRMAVARRHLAAYR